MMHIGRNEFAELSQQKIDSFFAPTILEELPAELANGTIFEYSRQ